MDEHGKGILGKRDATGQEIADAMGYAFREAAGEYKRAGIPIATWDWEKNEVVLISPEEIVIPDENEVADEKVEARDGRKG
jgi:hypothetical protein